MLKVMTMVHLQRISDPECSDLEQSFAPQNVRPFCRLLKLRSGTGFWALKAALEGVVGVRWEVSVRFKQEHKLKDS